MGYDYIALTINSTNFTTSEEIEETKVLIDQKSPWIFGMGWNVH